MTATNSKLSTALTFKLLTKAESQNYQFGHIQRITTTFPQVAVTSGGVCPAGYICPRGTKYPQQHPCPAGTFSSSLGAQNMSSCLPCPPGLYCNRTGLSQPSGICDTGKRISPLVKSRFIVLTYHTCDTYGE